MPTRRLSALLATMLVLSIACEEARDASPPAALPDSAAPSGEDVSLVPCSLSISADSFRALVRQGFQTEPDGVDTVQQLHPNGPRAAIALATGYSDTLPLDSGTLVAKIVALDSVAYPRFSLGGRDSVYLWVQTCQNMRRVLFVTPQDTVGYRKPPIKVVEHEKAGTKRVRLRDTTMSAPPDTLVQVYGLDSAYVATLPSDTTGGGDRLAVTLSTICMKCRYGWCTAT